MNTHEAEQLAHNLMAEHGLNSWYFQYDNAIRRFGYCSFTNKTISLSKPLTELNTREHVENTILHEIAHAIAGVNHGHDWLWKAHARRIGCTGMRCYSDEVIQPQGKYRALCPNGHASERSKKPRRGRLIACGKCCRSLNGGRFSKLYLLQYTKIDTV